MQTKISIACLAWLLAFSTIMFGQAPTATLVGQVVDTTKANIPGATIAIRNTATNETRTTKTNPDGLYTVSNLAPGVYEVTISMVGFDQLKESNLQLAADQTARLDAALQIGTATQAVTVSADVGLLNTETSSKGDLITPVEISEIPLNGRDFNDLAFTVAGVQPAEQSAKGAPYVANGSRADSSGVFIDGINDESPRDAGSQISPPLDSIQEFKMETSGYTAQYGRLSGSVVNMVTKSGGNRLHGSLFEFVRNDLFDAPPYNFTNIAVPKTKLRKNQFGGNLSGPVTIPHVYSGRDRTFFQFSIESLRSVTGTSATGLVPTDLERTGDFSQSGPGGTPYYFHNPKVSTKVLCAPPASPVVPTPAQVAGCLYPAPYYKIPNIDSVAKNLLAYYPHANLTVPPGSPNYFLNTDNSSNWNNSLIKINQRLGEKDQLSGLFLRRWSSSTNATSGSGLGTFGSTTDAHQSLIGINETRIFTANLVNDFRFGRTRTVSDEAANDAGTNYALQLGIQGTTTNPADLAFPSFKPTGFENLGDNASVPITYVVNDYDGSDLVTWTRGRHTFKFGGDILHVQLFQPTNTSKNGGFTYSGKITGGTTTNALADLLAGYPATSVLMTGGTTNHLLQTNYAGFAQDDYKASSSLTLNLGLRYELQTLPSEQNGQLTNFVPALGKIVYSNASTVPNLAAMLAQSGLTNYYISASAANYPTALVHTNNNRFSPRIGFALRPFHDDRTVIRAGYGIFYTGIRLSVIRTNLAGQYPFSATTSYQAAAPTTTLAGSAFIVPTTPFPATGGSLSGVLTPNGYDPNAPSAYLQSYNVTIERDLGKGMALEIAYAGSKGTHLAQEFDYNQERTSGVTASRPFPNFSAITLEEFNGTSHYDSGQVTVRRRFEHGLFFRVNYTYAKSLDSQSGANAAGAGGYFGNQNVLDPTAEYGLSDFDLTHNFTGTAIYRTSSRHSVLRDWQASGSVLAYSGQPFTPKVSGTQDLGQATRPNRLCNGTLSNRTLTKWFDPACFAIPASGFGNSGRNILRGPDSVTVNFALGRVFSMGEYGHFEFRWETFGTLNHPSFGYPSSTIGTAATAGVINTTTGGNRIMQFSGRYEF
jgi:hypothetical protein